MEKKKEESLAGKVKEIPERKIGPGEIERLKRTYGKPRNYQKRVFNETVKENVIAVGPTGCGKTFVAAMLARHIFENISLYKKDKLQEDVRMFFIVNKVILVHQQFKYFQDYFRCHDVKISMEMYHGQQQSVDLWRRRNWKRDLEKNHFYVMTAQIALNVISHGLLSMDDLDLLIFDECHHCIANSPYQRIMREFYYPCMRRGLSVPKIFGMTASPISIGVTEINKPKHERMEEQRIFQKKLVKIQNNLDSVVYVLGRNKTEFDDRKRGGKQKDIEIEPTFEMQKYLAEPKIYSQEYSTEIDVEYKKYQYILTEYNRIYREVGKEYVCHVINDCLNILYELGVWGVCRYLLQIKHMTGSAGQVKNAFVGLERRDHAETTLEMIDKLLEKLSGYSYRDTSVRIDHKKKEEKEEENDDDEDEDDDDDDEVESMMKKDSEMMSMSLSYVSDIPKPNQLSNKVNTLVQILEKYKKTHPDFCALIFVQQRKMAFLLNEIVKAMKVIDIHTACLMGHGSGEPKQMHQASHTGDGRSAHQKHHSSNSRRLRAERIRIKEPYVFGQSSAQQQHIMSLFGKSVDVVITTSVAEEGIDIQACHCVIRFDMFSDLRGYIQSKGRARKKNSDFVLLFNKEDESHQNLIENIKSAETNLIKTCLMSKRVKVQKKFSEKFAMIKHRFKKWRKRKGKYDYEDEEVEGEEESLFVKKTGAKCTLSEALQKLNQYCHLLPTDKYSTRKGPEFNFRTVKKGEEGEEDSDDPVGNIRDEQGEGRDGQWRRHRGRRCNSLEYLEVCSIRLPPNSTINQSIQGDPCVDKVYAKKSAALEVIKVLYSHGFLDDNLLPRHEYNLKAVKEEYRKQLREQSIERGNKKKKKKKKNDDDERNEAKKEVENLVYSTITNEVFRSSNHFRQNWIDSDFKKHHCYVYGFMVENSSELDEHSPFQPRKRYVRKSFHHHHRNRFNRSKSRRRGKRKNRFSGNNKKYHHHHHQNEDYLDVFSRVGVSDKLKNGQFFPFGLITISKLPNTIPPIDVYLERETDSPSTRLMVSCRGQMTIQAEHLDLLVRFHHLVNSVILRKTFSGFGRKNYLILPIHRDTGTIDWKLICACICLVDPKPKVKDIETTENVQEKDEENKKKELMNLRRGDLLFSKYNRMLYIFQRITRHRVHDENTFIKKGRRRRRGRRTQQQRNNNYNKGKSNVQKKEEEEVLTFEKYFQLEFPEYFSTPDGQEKKPIDPTLPIVEAIHPPGPSNVLFNRHLFHHSSFQRSQKKYVLLRDHCHKIPMNRANFLLCLKISGIFWFLENYLLLDDLNKILHVPFDLGHLREAMTASSTSEKFNYERLEFFGDRILKLVCSQDLFFRHPDYHEGILHAKRYVLTSNIYLKNRTIENHIYRFAFTKIFHPNLWCPPGYDIDVVDAKRQDRLPKKLLADIIESLTTCAFLSGGIEYSRYFLIEIGFPLKLNPTTDYSPVIIKCADELYREKGLCNLEKKIGYKFRYKTLLVQALAHQSFRYKDIRCYQRLEFLGDAILDYIITDYFYHKYPKATAENLHDLRGVAVSNEFFAMICVSEKIHKFLMYDSHKLRNDMEMYIIRLNDTKKRRRTPKKKKIFKQLLNEEEEEGEGEDDDDEEEEEEIQGVYGDMLDFDIVSECPKFLADVIESLVGAIYIDSNCSVERVSEVVMNLMEPYIISYVTMKRLKKSPMRELTELLQDFQIYDFEFVMDTCMGEHRRIVSTCTFVFRGRTIGKGEGKGDKVARKRCAENILDFIEKNPNFLEEMPDYVEIRDNEEVGGREKEEDFELEIDVDMGEEQGNGI